MARIAFHEMPDGRRIAYRFAPGDGPAVVFLPGYKSDMSGAKATTILNAAIANNRACLLLDYSGCGASSGDFVDGTLSRWREEVLALVAALCPGRLVLVGSSMGGWLMLLVALALPPERIAGLVGLAAAPDFTDWGFPADDRTRLAAGETVFSDNPDGPEPTPTHPAFWADGQGLRLLGRPIAIDAPVRLLHGQADEDVPWSVTLRLAEMLRSDAVQVTLVKDGDHRLSRDTDLALLIAQVGALAGWPG